MSNKSKPNLKRKAFNTQGARPTLIPKRFKQSVSSKHTEQQKQAKLKDQQDKQARKEQCRLLAVYRTERQRLEEQAKSVDEAIEAFVEELQDTT